MNHLMMEIIFLSYMLNAVLDKCFLMLNKETPSSSWGLADLLSLSRGRGIIHSLGTFDQFPFPVYSRMLSQMYVLKVFLLYLFNEDVANYMILLGKI